MTFNTMVGDKELEAILQHLPEEQIRALTTVSPRFNRVISNSVHLMKAFPIKMKSIKKLNTIKTSRKYCKVSATIQLTPEGREDLNELQRFVNKHSTSISNLSIWVPYKYDACQEGFIEQLITVLQALRENLESLTLILHHIIKDLPEIHPIEFLHLKKLQICLGTWNSLLKLFHSAKLEEIKFQEKGRQHPIILKDLKAFVESQDCLKKLSLSSIAFACPRIMEETTFELDEIVFDLNDFKRDPINGTIARRFLTKQLRTIKKLTWQSRPFPISTDLMFNILTSEKLQEIHIASFNPIIDDGGFWSPANRSITEMSVIGMFDFAQKIFYNGLYLFSKLKTLRFIHTTILTTTLSEISRKTDLKTLALWGKMDCAVFEFPHIEILDFLFFERCSQFHGIDFIIQMIQINRHAHHIVHEALRGNNIFQKAVITAGVEDKIIYRQRAKVSFWENYDAQGCLLPPRLSVECDLQYEYRLVEDYPHNWDKEL